MIDFSGDDIFVVATIQIGAAYSFHLVVRPVDQSIYRIIIDSNCVFDAVQLQYHVWRWGKGQTTRVIAQQ